MVVAHDAFWGARMEQMCCQLNKDVALPPCIEPVAHEFIRTYGCDDDEIPSSIIDVPTQTDTQWRSPEASLVMKRTNPTNVCKMCQRP
jgi:hypothetical protein